ncbi:MAG: hypothetical protein LUE29_07220 [Lachnospiraceae bacterium]|nr:hypothetical protein [Lachnospiraceae bacterium]
MKYGIMEEADETEGVYDLPGIRTGDFFYDTRVYLELFDRYMRGQEYGPRAFREHWQNIFDYLGYYLAIREDRDISEWCDELDDFIRNGFLGKERTVSEKQLRTMCTSLHRFYLCMKDNMVITNEEYDRVKEILWTHREKWQEAREKQEAEQALDDQRKFRRPRGMIMT